jgi:hypothetical protein
MSRDEFSAPAKDALGKRVGYRCSNPLCDVQTVGPHTSASKFANIGVASHISAATEGGPRYDVTLTPEERTSVDNGIWLCQSCAKLIDSDTAKYSVSVLVQWKVQAEAKSLRSLSGENDLELFPQPDSARHTPIPNIAGLTYVEARQRLIRAGWQPFLNHWQHGSSHDMQYGNGLAFWEMGYHEIRNASGTGLAHCWFAFLDVYRNVLVVMTAGEIDPETKDGAYVWRWYLEKPET